MAAQTATNAAPVSPEEWDQFVGAHPAATLYHTWRWTRFAGQVFGFDLHRLAQRDSSGAIVGVLPLVLQTSPLFGRRLVSLPFFNYGGPLGATPEIELGLISQAAGLGPSLRAGVLEIRDRSQRGAYVSRLDKVTVELELPESEAALAKALGAKVRSQVRRADRESPSVEVGGSELLDDFYPVFAATMRDLGTPVYPIRFFHQMLDELAEDCSIVVVRLDGRRAAAALLTHFRDRTEIPWAAALHELRSTSVNMRLYWECLRYAISRGSRVFDFGRSTADSGTHRFKLQWGGVTRQLYWVYPLESSDPVKTPGSGSLRVRAQNAWSRLPLGLANRLGPLISPGLPW